MGRVRPRLACSFWLVSALARDGRVEEAFSHLTLIVAAPEISEAEAAAR